jgi:hypothetical protein
MKRSTTTRNTVAQNVYATMTSVNAACRSTTVASRCRNSTGRGYWNSSASKRSVCSPSRYSSKRWNANGNNTGCRMSTSNEGESNNSRNNSAAVYKRTGFV